MICARPRVGCPAGCPSAGPGWSTPTSRTVAWSPGTITEAIRVQGGSAMPPTAWELAFNRRVVHPIVVGALERGLAPPTFALLETTGRRTGRRRVVPVANGLQGNTFWLISGRGERVGYVHNIRGSPGAHQGRAGTAPGRDSVRMAFGHCPSAAGGRCRGPAPVPRPGPPRIPSRWYGVAQARDRRRHAHDPHRSRSGGRCRSRLGGRRRGRELPVLVEGRPDLR